MHSNVLGHQIMVVYTPILRDNDCLNCFYSFLIIRHKGMNILSIEILDWF